jgi:hypothetical protein
MKTHLTMILAAVLLLASCATRSDPTFMNNASASINGGWMDAGSGQMMMSPGIQTPTVHPFFGR